MCFTVGLSKQGPENLAAMRPGATPVPIPNTTVKTRTADGTALDTVRESRRLPELKKNKEAQRQRERPEGNFRGRGSKERKPETFFYKAEK